VGRQEHYEIVKGRMMNTWQRFMSYVVSLFRHPLSGAVLAFGIIASCRYYPLWMVAGIILAICVAIRLLIDVWRGAT
jgi:hypothetical protein